LDFCWAKLALWNQSMTTHLFRLVASIIDNLPDNWVNNWVKTQITGQQHWSFYPCSGIQQQLLLLLLGLDTWTFGEQIGSLKIKSMTNPFIQVGYSTPLLWTWIIIQRSHTTFFHNEYRAELQLFWFCCWNSLTIWPYNSWRAFKKRINCGLCSFCQSEWHFVTHQNTA